MMNSNIKELLLEDIETLRTQPIPTLSGQAMYGTMGRYFGFFMLYIGCITLGLELFFRWLHIGALGKDSIGTVISFGIFGWVVVGAFLGIAFFARIAPKAVIFNKSIRPMMKSGDLIASKLKKYMFIQMTIYVVILILATPATGGVLLSNMPAFIICSILHNFIENSEIQRLGIPELPRLIRHFLEGHKENH